MNGDTPVAFRKSTYSGAANSQCVEVGVRDGEVVLTDTEAPGRELRFTAQEWEAFVEGAKDGQFDGLV